MNVLINFFILLAKISYSQNFYNNLFSTLIVGYCALYRLQEDK